MVTVGRGNHPGREEDLRERTIFPSILKDLDTPSPGGAIYRPVGGRNLIRYEGLYSAPRPAGQFTSIYNEGNRRRTDAESGRRREGD